MTKKSNLSSHFEWRSRSPKDRDEERFCTLKDDAPEWLRDAVYACHEGSLPDDWIYEECFAAVSAIDDESITDRDGDGLHEHADSRVDIYTKNVFQWAADSCLSTLFAEAEEEAKDCGEPEDTVKRLMQIQFFAIRRIASSMVEAWRESVDEEENAEEASV